MKKIPSTDPEGTRLPIKLDTTSNDVIARERLAYLERPDPHFRTYGPKTRREFIAFTACCK